VYPLSLCDYFGTTTFSILVFYINNILGYQSTFLEVMGVICGGGLTSVGRFFDFYFDNKVN
jgi:hypothetical protein